VLHILIWGIGAFFGGLRGDGTEIWAPLTAWALQWGVWSAADAALCALYFFCNQAQNYLCKLVANIAINLLVNLSMLAVYLYSDYCKNKLYKF